METKKKTILLVEDEDNILEYYKLLLEMEGYNLIEARDGEEAIEIFKRIKVDLVIIDLIMPKMDGQDVIEYMKSRNRDQKIIIITGDLYSGRHRAIAEAHGIRHVLEKPNILKSGIFASIENELGVEQACGTIN